jgi:hypothetical protein
MRGTSGFLGREGRRRSLHDGGNTYAKNCVLYAFIAN